MWTTLGTIPPPTTPSSISSAHLLLPSLGVHTPPTQRSAEKGWPVVVAALGLGLEVVEREPSAWELGRQHNEAGRGLGLPRPATTATLAAEDA